MRDLQESKNRWLKINAPIGKKFGYPECCIKEFCDQPPELMEEMDPGENDIGRYKAGCLEGEFTGFIPCIKHSKMILAGEITLGSLIKDRDENLPEFPEA
jgi:hypothetical protein